MRTVLIMADGVQTLEQMRSASAGLGLAPDFLEALVAAGLIEIRPDRRSGSAPVPTSPVPLSRPMPLGEVDILVGPPSVPPTLPPADPSATEAELFLKARQYIKDKIVGSLKLRGFFLVLKLEKCSTRAELAQLLPEFEKAIAKANGPEVAEVLVARAREMLR